MSKSVPICQEQLGGWVRAMGKKEGREVKNKKGEETLPKWSGRSGKAFFRNQEIE